MKVGDDELTLSSGRQAYANCCFIGLRVKEGRDYLDLAEGYDGGITTDGSVYDDAWTPEEHAELASFMIAKWGEYLSRHI